MSLLKTNEVAERCRVTPETVRDWAASGRLRVAERTPGGHLRFDPRDVATMMSGARVADPEADRIESMLLKARGAFARVLSPRTA